MQTACAHCGQAHLLQDAVVAKHPKVQFRCTRCGKTTIVEVKRRVDDTMVISPMPSFARADGSTATVKLAPIDDGMVMPANAQIVLTVRSGPDAGKTYTMNEVRAVIGRAGADLALNDPEISRHHCVLEVRDMTVSLKDLDSTNGTFFEGERVRAAVLRDGAEFRVGSSVIGLAILPK